MRNLSKGLGYGPGRWPDAACLLALCLARAIWYLHRPLRHRSSRGYTPITHDGRQKILVGTDGSRLYFNQMSGPTTGEAVAQVATSSGGTVPIPVPLPNAFLVDVSPDASNFLISADSGLWNVRILGCQARRLGNAYHAFFSPVGNSVAFSTADRGINVVGSDGTGAHRLAHAGETVNGIASSPVSDIAWSPDGGSIRFTMKDRIWEISSTGSNLDELMPSWHGSPECCGKWTRDGKLFLFISDGQIWVHDESLRGDASDKGLKLLRLPLEPVRLFQARRRRLGAVSNPRQWQ